MLRLHTCSCYYAAVLFCSVPACLSRCCRLAGLLLIYMLPSLTQGVTAAAMPQKHVNISAPTGTLLQAREPGAFTAAGCTSAFMLNLRPHLHYFCDAVAWRTGQVPADVVVCTWTVPVGGFYNRAAAKTLCLPASATSLKNMWLLAVCCAGNACISLHFSLWPQLAFLLYLLYRLCCRAAAHSRQTRGILQTYTYYISRTHTAAKAPHYSMSTIYTLTCAPWRRPVYQPRHALFAPSLSAGHCGM